MSPSLHEWLWLFSLSLLKASFSDVQAVMLRQIYSLGHFPNFAEKHEVFSHHASTEASSSVPGRWTGSTGQLSRRRMGRNPDLRQGCPQPVPFSIRSTKKVFPDSCMHFTGAKRSTDRAAAWICLNKLHSERCKVLSIRAQRGGDTIFANGATHFCCVP